MAQEQARTSSQPVTLLHRAGAAAGASVVSAFVVNPLDVVKTRIQAQGALNPNVRSSFPTSTLLEKWSFAGCECVRLPPAELRASTAGCGPACVVAAPQGTAAAAAAAVAQPAAVPPRYSGTLQGLRLIAREEGMGVLWRGTDVALMMAIPMVGIYLPLYDYLLDHAKRAGSSAAYAPLLAGTLARTAAVYCTAPFELLRTRLQAAPSQAAGLAARSSSSSSGSSLMRHLPSGGGGTLRSVARLWTGVGATLARDVPFSALYWGMVEPIRGGLLPHGAHNEWEVFAANVTAGSVAGGLAGAITTPLDVVKTRTQLQADRSHPLLRTLRGIAAREGAAGLFQGWSARSAKAAPACAIVLSSYELLKHMHAG